LKKQVRPRAVDPELAWDVLGVPRLDADNEQTSPNAPVCGAPLENDSLVRPPLGESTQGLQEGGWGE
jgi:hypothetical protein